MPYSVTDISNLALANLGQIALTDIEDQTPVGAYCRTHFYNVRDSVLQSHPWNFAMDRIELSRLSDEPLSGWAYYYQIPSTCLRVMQINDVYPWDCNGYYSIEGGKLATDWETVIIKYVKREEDTSLYPPLFIEALAVKLAEKLSIPLKGSEETRQALVAQYKRITGPDAMAADAFEGRPRPRLPYEESMLVRSRGWGSYANGNWGYFRTF
jgi:hypothetical protein